MRLPHSSPHLTPQSVEQHSKARKAPTGNHSLGARGPRGGEDGRHSRGQRAQGACRGVGITVSTSFPGPGKLGLLSMLQRTFQKASEVFFRTPAIKALSGGCLYGGRRTPLAPEPGLAEPQLPPHPEPSMIYKKDAVTASGSL